MPCRSRVARGGEDGGSGVGDGLGVGEGEGEGETAGPPPTPLPTGSRLMPTTATTTTAAAASANLAKVFMSVILRAGHQERRCGVASSRSSTRSQDAVRGFVLVRPEPRPDDARDVAFGAHQIDLPGRRPRIGVERRAQRAHRVMESRVGRPDRDAEDLGDPVERQVEVVVQHHHRAMVEGQAAEAALELVAIDDRAQAVVRDGSSTGSSRRFGAQRRSFRPSA